MSIYLDSIHSGTLLVKSEKFCKIVASWNRGQRFYFKSVMPRKRLPVIHSSDHSIHNAPIRRSHASSLGKICTTSARLSVRSSVNKGAASRKAQSNKYASYAYAFTWAAMDRTFAISIEMTGKTCEIISGNIYRRYIAPCIQFPYIDLTQASYCPIPLIGRWIKRLLRKICEHHDSYNRRPHSHLRR